MYCISVARVVGLCESILAYALLTTILMVISPDFPSAKCFLVPAMRSFGPVAVDMSARTACALMEWVEESLLARSVHGCSDEGEV